jgi:hypothetical protein
MRPVLSAALLSLLSLGLVGCGGDSTGDSEGTDSVIDSDGDGVADDEDCDDEDASIHPGASEVWDDGIDQDCDGVADVEGAECSADLTVTFPDGTSTTLDGCMDWALDAEFEYDPDDPPEVVSFSLILGATTARDFDCRFELTQLGVCGAGYYDQQSGAATTTFVLSDCSGVNDAFEGSFPADMGSLRIDTIVAGTTPGSFSGQPLPLTLEAHLHMWTAELIEVEGDISVTLTQVAGDSEEQFNCAVDDGDRDSDGFVGTYFGGDDCDDERSDIYPWDRDGDGAAEFCGFGRLSGGECAIESTQGGLSGGIQCWVENDWTSGRPTDTNFVQMVYADQFYAALDTDGRISVFGNPYENHGQKNPPSGTGYVSICGGDNYACTISATGVATCWGEDPLLGNSFLSIKDEATGDFIQVSCYDSVACALDTAGEITCWGASGAVAKPPHVSGFTALSLGRGNACALDATGTLTCWGNSIDAGVTDAPTGTGYTALFDGICALDAVGAMACWDDDELAADLPTGSGYVEMSTRGCAIDGSGALECWLETDGRNKSIPCWDDVACY